MGISERTPRLFCKPFSQAVDSRRGTQDAVFSSLLPSQLEFFCRSLFSFDAKRARYEPGTRFVGSDLLDVRYGLRRFWRDAFCDEGSLHSSRPLLDCNDVRIFSPSHIGGEKPRRSGRRECVPLRLGNRKESEYETESVPKPLDEVPLRTIHGRERERVFPLRRGGRGGGGTVVYRSEIRFEERLTRWRVRGSAPPSQHRNCMRSKQ